MLPSAAVLRDNITSQDWSTNQRRGSPPGQPIRGEDALLGWNVVLQSLQHCTCHSQVCRWHLQLELLLFLLMPIVHCHQTALCAMSHSDTPLPTLHCPQKATRNCCARNINPRYHNDRLFKESRDKVDCYLRISVLMGHNNKCSGPRRNQAPASLDIPNSAGHPELLSSLKLTLLKCVKPS